MMPQVTIVAKTPRWRTSRPPRTTAAALTRTVRIRPTPIAQAVPASLEMAAAGIISSVIPGGWTMMKSRYGTRPWMSRNALPKSAPSS
jgi:hypothetical protein